MSISSPSPRDSSCFFSLSSTRAFFLLRAPANQSASSSFFLISDLAAVVVDVSGESGMALSSSVGFKVTLDGFPPTCDGEGGGFSLSEAAVDSFFSLFGSSSFSASSSSCFSPSQSEAGRPGRVEVTVEAVEVVEVFSLRSGEGEVMSSVENLHERKDQHSPWHPSQILLYE